jgi:SAM-dependent methyltransferase
MAQLEFDDEGSRLVEEFNESAGAKARRERILSALSIKAGSHVLDVGSGPGHQAYELAAVVGADGLIAGVDSAESALEIARRRCSNLTNVTFQLGDASNLPFPDATFDAAMSSQTFEYLEAVPAGLAEMHRVLKPGGRVLIHDTDWGATLWRTKDPARMDRILNLWDGHLEDPHLPRTLGPKLAEAGFTAIGVEAIVQLETDCNQGSVSSILMKFVTDYVASQGISQDEADAWASELVELSARGEYFYSSNEYIFTGVKP